MGVYLSVACTDVDAEEGHGNQLRYAVGEMQVRRLSAKVKNV
jgi:hypothetical protein